MALVDPISAYNARSNMEAMLAKMHLESHGIEAFVTEDLSVSGFWQFGTLPEIHKPQVWVSRKDAEVAGRLLAEFEDRRSPDLDAPLEDQGVVEALCEECNQASHFVGSLAGTVQNCPHCSAHMDVGEFDWPEYETAATECEVEAEKAETKAAETKAAEDANTIEVVCEECQKASRFDRSLDGTLQYCPHCSAYMDVGESDWDEGEWGESDWDGEEADN